MMAWTDTGRPKGTDYSGGKEMDLPAITEAIMEIKQTLARIENDVTWIKEKACDQKSEITTLCRRVEDLEDWQNKAKGALVLLEIAMAGIGFTLILKMLGVV